MRTIRLSNHVLRFLLVVAGVQATHLSFGQSEAVELDQRILKDTDREFGGVYREMGVVQRKAMDKGGRFLFSIYGSMDFSDMPYSNLGLNFDIGYALSDFFEIYVHANPLFFNQRRRYATNLNRYECSQESVDSGICEAGDTPLANLARMKSAYGGTIIWAPSYGKDSIGTRTILRSDTFFKFSYARLSFKGLNLGTGSSQSAKSSNLFQLGIGKTFFLGKYVGIRAVASGVYAGVPNLEGKVNNFMFGVGEIGTMIYW